MNIGKDEQGIDEHWNRAITKQSNRKVEEWADTGIEAYSEKEVKLYRNTGRSEMHDR